MHSGSRLPHLFKKNNCKGLSPRLLWGLKFWDPMAKASRKASDGPALPMAFSISMCDTWPSPLKSEASGPWTAQGPASTAPLRKSQVATDSDQAPPLPGPEKNKGLNKYKVTRSWSQLPSGTQIHCCVGSMAPGTSTMPQATFSFLFLRATC